MRQQGQKVRDSIVKNAGAGQGQEPTGAEMRENDLRNSIRELVRYGLATGLVEPEDTIYTTNRLLELLAWRNRRMRRLPLQRIRKKNPGWRKSWKVF